MIQRIQTLFLLGGLGALLIVFFIPFASMTGQDGILYLLQKNGILNTHSNQIVIQALPLLLLINFSIILEFLCIFLFKNRRLQIRICIFNLVLIVGIAGLMYYYFAHAKNVLETTLHHFKITAVLPIVGAILNYLAFRNILKDEILIKSVDRIR